MTNPTEQIFQGVRVEISSTKPYEQVLAQLLDDIGETPVDTDALEQEHESWESYRQEAEGLAGPSGFMLFGLINHGAWMKKVGAFGRSMRVILGNPAIAITMLKHDVKAGLFAPVELLLLEEKGNRSTLIYVKPSSLMVIEPDDELLSAALSLDQKLEALAVKITS
jgi:uncharacterized protein (DUF302 family)